MILHSRVHPGPTDPTAMLSVSTGFSAPVMLMPTSSSMSISMKAITAPVSVWADPVAAHTSDVSMTNIAWDPLGLASAENLDSYREAELKHGRLAMLAALGWPAAEKLEPVLASITGRADELVETGGRAPSLLNGGLEEAQIPFFLAGVFSIAGYCDYLGTKIQKQQGLEPGNVGFDPLGLLPTDKPTLEKYKLAELKHGRIAMIAIAFYALEEGTTQTSILKETVPLFGEIGRLIKEGPIQGNIDFVKDLNADARALIADSAKEEAFYGDAFTTKIFDRPAVRDFNVADLFGLALPALFMGAVSGGNGKAK